MTQLQERAPQVGEPAPDFTLKDADFKPVSLHDFAGRHVILAFYPAAFSGTCTAELCTLQDSLTRLNEANAQVLGISIDLPYTLKRFKQDKALSFPLLSDFDREAMRAYGVVDPTFGGFSSGVAMRSVFVVDPNGAIAWEWIAESQGQQPDYEKVLSGLPSIS